MKRQTLGLMVLVRLGLVFCREDLVKVVRLTMGPGFSTGVAAMVGGLGEKRQNRRCSKWVIHSVQVPFHPHQPNHPSPGLVASLSEPHTHHPSTSHGK